MRLHMKRVHLLVLLTFITTFISAKPVDQATPIDAWQRVLENFVDEQGRTDFSALADSSDDLDTFIAYLGQHGPRSEPSRYDTPDKVLAFHINAYNALAMHGVIDKGIPNAFDSILKRAGFFKFRQVEVDGMRMSLSAYENDIIRPLGDARVHFALNCMVRDCPRLPRIPFTAATLDAQLQTQAREFFSHTKHLRLSSTQKRVQVSRILEFYTDDFASSGKREDLIPYINQFRDEAIPQDWELEFLDYDWTVNHQP